MLDVSEVYTDAHQARQVADAHDQEAFRDILCEEDVTVNPGAATARLERGEQ